MKVSFILPFHPRRPSGGARVVFAHAEGLAALGHDVSILTPRLEVGAWNRGRREPSHLVRKVAKGVRDLLGPIRPNWYELSPEVEVRTALTVSQRSLPPADVLVATGWRTAEVIARATGGSGGLYLVQHVETWDGPADRVKRTWRLPLRKVAVSTWLGDELRRHGVPDEELRVIVNGLDHDQLGVFTPPRDRPPTVAMMWGEQPWKGGLDGLAALRSAREVHRELTAILFGTGPAPDGLPTWVRYQRSPPRRLLVEGVYNEAAVYLCPSWLEGFGLPPAEAMACGCAVVTTDCGGVRDFAIGGATARMVPAHAPDALAEALVEVLEDDEERVRLAEAGCELVRGFTWERATSELESWILESTS